VAATGISTVCWGVCKPSSQTEPYAQHFSGYSFPWEFSDAETAAARLGRAGFEEIETSLEEAPTTFPDGRRFQQFVESVILRNHLERLAGPRSARRDFSPS